MADSDNAAAGGTAATAESEPTASRPDQPLVISTQYVKDLSFENPNAPGIYAEMRQAPDLNVHIDVAATRLQERNFEIVLKLRVNAEVQSKSAFIIELDYGGLVTVGTSVPDEHVQAVALVEAPRHLFPFARAIIAEATREGGFPPLLINPIDFLDLYKKQASRKSSEAVDNNEPASSEVSPA